MTDQPTDDERMNWGQLAAEVFKNPIFAIIFQQLQAEYFEKWANAPLENAKEMASLKYQHTALVDLMKRMTHMIREAGAIAEKRQQQNSPEARQARHLDTQGFGLNFTDQRGA